MPRQDKLRPLLPIHTYPASFGADLAHELICSHTKAGDVVLDPFVGAGTTALRALLNSRHAIGIDIDPIACRISRVLTSEVDVPHLVSATNQLKLDLRYYNTQLNDRPKIYKNIQSGQEFKINSLVFRVPGVPAIDYWFHPSHKAVLSIFCALVSDEPDPLVRQAFEVAISSAVIRKWPNTLSYAMDIDHSRPHRPHQPEILTIDKQFLLVDRVLSRVENTVTVVQETIASKDSSSRILEGDAVEQLSGLDSNTVDFVLTSPPYLNAIDYPRAHKFSQWWLSPETQPLSRSQYTGLGRATQPEIDDNILPQIATLSGSLSDFEGMAIYKNITRYVHDIWGTIEQLHRVVTFGGIVALVVADNVLAGKVFPVSTITEELLKFSGFSKVAVTRRTIKANRRRYPFGANGFTGTMKNEYVITAEKPNMV